MIECQRCGNIDSRTIYKHHTHLICRKCIQFSQNDSSIAYDYEVNSTMSELSMPYQLTAFQQRCSDEIEAFAFTNNVVVEAVCGAGKTELVLAFIQKCMRSGLRVGWAIPRRQVVLELALRLQNLFPKLRVIPVCEGYTKQLQGDLIVLTTHQLFRFNQYFDYLIIDEVDAFPFAGNQVLQGIAHRSYRKQVLYLSATLNSDLELDIQKRSMKRIELSIRPSLKPMPVPIERRSFFILHLRDLLRRLQTEDDYLIFVSTIRKAKRLGRLLKLPVITSKSDHKELIIEKFRTHKIRHLITTTILERGVTFPNISVIVFDADHPVYTVSSLVQIAGRVGRGVQVLRGQCLFYTTSRSREVETCIQKIERANQSAQDALKLSNLV